MTIPSNMSATARTMLVAAGKTAVHAVTLPDRLPVAAQRAVVKSMVMAGLVEETTVNDDQPAWRTTETGERFGLRATLAGLAAAGVLIEANVDGASQASPENGAQNAAVDASQSAAGTAAQPAAQSPRVRLRIAAEAVVAAWDDAVRGRVDLPACLDDLRTALTTPSPVRGTVRSLRTDTKRTAVLTLLRRPGGATVAQVSEATGWASHTVRGFFAGLKKKGIPVQVLDRVRQVGPGKQGPKGSYSVYRVEEVG